MRRSLSELTFFITPNRCAASQTFQSALRDNDDLIGAGNGDVIRAVKSCVRLPRRTSTPPPKPIFLYVFRTAQSFNDQLIPSFDRQEP